jgi:hypothetical protein
MTPQPPLPHTTRTFSLISREHWYKNWAGPSLPPLPAGPGEAWSAGSSAARQPSIACGTTDGGPILAKVRHDSLLGGTLYLVGVLEQLMSAVMLAIDIGWWPKSDVCEPAIFLEGSEDVR